MQYAKTHRKPQNNFEHKLRRYKITPEEYEEIKRFQDYKCAICGIPLDDTGRECLDHDYKTGMVRQILCSKCNTGLGMFNDNSELLRKAAVYLDTHQLIGGN